MEKFVPYEKCSKKEKKRQDAEKRSDWNGVCPVTQVEEDHKKTYRRKPKYPQNFDE